MTTVLVVKIVSNQGGNKLNLFNKLNSRKDVFLHSVSALSSSSVTEGQYLYKNRLW